MISAHSKRFAVPGPEAPSFRPLSRVFVPAVYRERSPEGESGVWEAGTDNISGWGRPSPGGGSAVGRGDGGEG